MKRRLRELARAALPESGIAGADHVLIGRAGGNDIAFADLADHLASALQRAAKKLAQKAAPPQRPRRNDREAADPRRARLADRPLAHPAADLPLRALVQRICDPGLAAPWCDQGWLDGDKTAIALPPVGRPWL